MGTNQGLSIFVFVLTCLFISVVGLTSCTSSNSTSTSITVDSQQTHDIWSDWDLFDSAAELPSPDATPSTACLPIPTLTYSSGSGACKSKSYQAVIRVGGAHPAGLSVKSTNYRITLTPVQIGKCRLAQ